MAPFDYPPLSDPNHFRVLHLHHSQDRTEAPNFTLEEVPYAQPPSYAAISHTWDGQGFDTEAYCEGSLFKVTRNCSDILRCLRKAEGTVTIWLDQICVDQKSDVDKSVHVARMDEIYEKCTEVLIWMTGLPEDAVPVLRRIMDEGNMPADNPMSEEEQRQQTTAETSLLRTFQFLPWHTRMWTLQEVIVPPHTNLRLLTPRGTLPILTSQPFISRSVSLARLQLVRLSMGNWPGMEHWKLSSILQYTLDRQCYLPHDKIYALYGILKRKSTEEGKKLLPKVDYSRAVGEVYEEATWWALRQGDLQMLYLGAMADSEKEEVEASGEMPSWVPDLARISKAGRAPLANVTVPGWSGGLQLKERRYLEYPKYDERQHVLELKGHKADVVVSTSAELPKLAHLLRDDGSASMSRPQLLEQVKPFLHTVFEFRLQARQQFGSTLHPNQLTHLLGGTTKDSILAILTKFGHFFEELNDMWADNRATQLLHRLGSKEVAEPDVLNHFNAFVSTLVFRSRYTLFLTRAGRFGISLGTTKPGDAIIVVDAVDQPLIFRPAAQSDVDGGAWELVGDAKVLGLMDELEGLNPEMEILRVV